MSYERCLLCGQPLKQRSLLSRMLFGKQIMCDDRKECDRRRRVKEGRIQWEDDIE